MKPKTSLAAILALTLCLCCATPTKAATSEKAYTLPTKVENVEKPVISLNGEWQFRYSPKDKWNKVIVPAEVAIQGYAIEHNKPFLYRRDFTVPDSFKGKQVILRFDGVYSHAKLIINGIVSREHDGGFTRWEVDITELINVGKKNILEVEVTDKIDDISYASGYAHHPIGGILRDVTLFALPKAHIYNLNIETQLDTIYNNANLLFNCDFKNIDTNTEVEFSLTDPKGNKVALLKNRFALEEGANKFTLPVKQPTKWDAEHPNLYSLDITLYNSSKKEIYKTSRKVGFRDIKIIGNKMLVNGKPVKLRGACRHDIHPTLGRTVTAELDSLDAALFKLSNMNFVRTSHYPPTERFLEYCDKFGIYVECETAVCFVDTHRQKNYAPANSESDTTYTDKYLSQCREMVKSLRTHPSIILWSIGNESLYGSNFAQCWDWIKATDKTRPVIFSYPGSVDKNKTQIYDILSMHYQDVYGNVDQYGKSTRNFEGHGIPALYDEWAHPACYTYSTLQTDPNIREFWGKSLDMMWSGLYNAPGGLGGAIWGYIDETFALPEPQKGTSYWKEFAHTAKPAGFQGNSVGYGEWGIVDVWRRPKPEFWSTKKAYSPVSLQAGNNILFTPGQRIVLTVYNRFDHTNLNEISASYKYKGTKKPITLPSTEPHQKCFITIPAESWQEGEPLLIEFFGIDGELIDAYEPVLGKQIIDYPSALSGKTLSVKDENGFVTICGEGFEIPFDKATGLITNATANGKVIIEKGPLLNVDVNLNHLTGAEVRSKAKNFYIDDTNWQKKSFSCTHQNNEVHINLVGTYKDVTVDFVIKIAPNGQLDIDYTTEGVPNGFLRETGLLFYMPNTIQQLEWKRSGYWSYYPKGELSANDGSTPLYNQRHPLYSQRPEQPWTADTHNYFYWADMGTNCKQPLTQIAKGMKENIYYYTLLADTTAKATQLSVISENASVACRINKRSDEQLILYTSNQWDYPEIAWGNYCKTLEALPCYGSIRLRIK